MAKNRQFQTQKETQVNQEPQEAQQEQTAQEQTSEQQVSLQTDIQEPAAQEQQPQEPQASQVQEQVVQEQAKPARMVETVKEPEPTTPQAQVQVKQDTPIVNEVTVPDDIKTEVKEDFFKFLKHFSASASDSDKAWARNALTTAVKYKRKRPLDTKGCLEATMFTLGLMTSAIQYPENAQQRMRYVFACFKWCDCIFDLELTGRGANQLTAQQYKQYTALSSLFHYWADLGSGAEINKRFNVAKEMGNVFDPIIAQRVVSIVGA